MGLFSRKLSVVVLFCEVIVAIRDNIFGERWVAKTALNAALERDTAMPSFAPTLQDEQIWKIAMFLKQMDKLPPAVDAEWKKIPSVAATALPSGLHRRLELLQWNYLSGPRVHSDRQRRRQRAGLANQRAKTAESLRFES